MVLDFSEIFSTPPRILVVDNDENTAKIYKDLLELWGFQPIVAEGSGQALLQDAREKARLHRCQFALVDLRLIDDFDNDDTSGLELARQIKPTVTIIVTGFASVPIAVENIQNRNAADFIIKGGPPQDIYEKLKRVAVKFCARERGLQIGPDKIILPLAETMFEETVPDSGRDQLLDILARLFPDARSIKLEKMNPAAITSGFAQVPRPRSVIVKVFEDDLQPVILKLARVRKIETEVERYNKYIYKRLLDHAAPNFDDSKKLWDIGGIKFSYTGNIEKTFEHLYKNETVKTIQHTLHRFFAHTWMGHYNNARKVTDASLLELYRQVWEDDWIRRIETFPPLDPGQVMGPERWLQVEAPEPLAWFRQRILNDPDGEIGHAAETAIAVTHGDLHAGNLLIDDSNNAWVIDFERTGEGHALQDFIELESDLINRMLPGGEHLPFYHRLCFAVTAPTELGPLNTDFGLTEPANAKIIQTISIIRSLARECTGITDIHQYLVGLLFNTLFRATIIKNTEDPSELKSQYRALMLASVICHRLDHWDEPWPPENWLNLK
jgi:ActR/RegA family two-component response regulator